ncbi:MAG: hypothetical protein QM527_01500 [Alphaproteobacteria bacterium]|nr:hypothetical protein [Alphaproteobacteria bacterium]
MTGPVARLKLEGQVMTLSTCDLTTMEDPAALQQILDPLGRRFVLSDTEEVHPERSG